MNREHPSDGTQAEFESDARLDQRMRSLVVDVEVPNGLADRLKAAARSAIQSIGQDAECNSVNDFPVPEVDLSAAVDRVVADQGVSATLLSEQVATASASLQSSLVSHAAQSASGSGLSGGIWRRAAVVGFLAACLIGFAMLASYLAEPHERRWAAAECIAILEDLEQSPAEWQPAEESLTAELNSVRELLMPLPIKSQRDVVREATRVSGRAFQLSAPDGAGAVLLELHVPRGIQGVSGRFELLPTPSGGWSLAVMVRGDKTYVLAAYGTERRLQSLIRQVQLT
ncbi:MAG: hypothetical protein U0892_01670 [Pirellulales bacterium]